MCLEEREPCPQLLDHALQSLCALSQLGHAEGVLEPLNLRPKGAIQLQGRSVGHTGAAGVGCDGAREKFKVYPVLPPPRPIAFQTFFADVGEGVEVSEVLGIIVGGGVTTSFPAAEAMVNDATPAEGRDF